MSDKKIVSLSPSSAGRRFAALPHDDYVEIQAVVACYGRFYDDDRIDDLVDLMTEDAVFYPNWPGVAPEQVSGKAALREFFAGARAHCSTTNIQPRHHATNIIIAAGSANETNVSAGMLYAESSPGAEPTLKLVGQYDYVLVKHDDRWSIARWSMRYDK